MAEPGGPGRRPHGRSQPRAPAARALANPQGSVHSRENPQTQDLLSRLDQICVTEGTRALIELQKLPARDPPRGPPRLPSGARAVSLPTRGRLRSGLGGAGRWKEQRRSPAEGRRGLSLQEPREGTTAERVTRPLLLRVALFWARSGVSMARGNQRELARQKNMKKSQEISKGKRKEDSLTTSQRKQRDSEIMQQKQKAANEKKSMQTREK
ncbi:small EDRK-rich factor 1 [Herpailurus yagouaroundi]|nr:uncharacterized protein LOC121041987 [Puma yagouaroundi]